MAPWRYGDWRHLLHPVSLSGPRASLRDYVYGHYCPWFVGVLSDFFDSGGHATALICARVQLGNGSLTNFPGRVFVVQFGVYGPRVAHVRLRLHCYRCS